jgi:alkylated DNA repair dioxygenase AlkB
MKAKARFERIENEDALQTLEGFRYQPALIDTVYESVLLAHIRELPFREFEFHGYLGKRQIVSFGWRYDYTGHGGLQPAEEIPEFLFGLRALAASFAKLEPPSLQQVLVTEYRPGAGIGWHRDKPVFGQVVGISLLAPCVLRFRRKRIDERKSRPTWERVNVFAEPRSAYLLSGPSRLAWEHSIARVDELRYSITFRSLREV